MLEDARSLKRRRDFSVRHPVERESIDDYIRFLESVQKVFSPFPISTKISLTAHNKL
ncbi:MAG: hypothetical protein ABH843_05330 [Candidatus Omnitrophota bacterium]